MKAFSLILFMFLVFGAAFVCPAAPLHEYLTWQHFWVVDVTAKQLACRAVDLQGKVFDVYPEDVPDAAAATTYFKTLTSPYPSDPTAPERIRKIQQQRNTRKYTKGNQE